MAYSVVNWHATCDSEYICVRLNGQDSPLFPVTTAVQQGCVATPELFNYVIHNLVLRVTSEIPSVLLGEYQLTDLDYADDTTLFAEVLTYMSTALKIYSEEAGQMGLRVNWSKMKLMHVGHGPDLPSIDIDGSEVEFVASHTYLGSTVTNTGDLQGFGSGSNELPMDRSVATLKHQLSNQDVGV